MLNVLDVVRITVLTCVMFSSLPTPNVQKGDNSLRTRAWSSLYYVNYMFLFLHFIVLGNSEWWIPPGEMLFSKVLVNTSKQKQKGDPSSGSCWHNSTAAVLLPLSNPHKDLYTCILQGDKAFLTLYAPCIILQYAYSHTKARRIDIYQMRCTAYKVAPEEGLI